MQLTAQHTNHPAIRCTSTINDQSYAFESKSIRGVQPTLKVECFDKEILGSFFKFQVLKTEKSIQECCVEDGGHLSSAIR